MRKSGSAWQGSAAGCREPHRRAASAAPERPSRAQRLQRRDGSRHSTSRAPHLGPEKAGEKGRGEKGRGAGRERAGKGGKGQERAVSGGRRCGLGTSGPRPVPVFVFVRVRVSAYVPFARARTSPQRTSRWKSAKTTRTGAAAPRALPRAARGSTLCCSKHARTGLRVSTRARCFRSPSRVRARTGPWQQRREAPRGQEHPRRHRDVLYCAPLRTNSQRIPTNPASFVSPRFVRLV